MIRMLTKFALCELALLGAFFGVPAAQADPAEECCGLPRSGECSGCLGGYLLGPGYLYGCIQAGIAMGCDTTSVECNRATGPIIRWKNGSNCMAYQEISGGVVIYMQGCAQPTECD